MSDVIIPLEPLKEGEYAPDFTVPTDNGSDFTLSDYRNKKNIVVYFYPKDDTPGCTKQAIAFTEFKNKLEREDTIVIGISKDDITKHQQFKAKHNLTIQLGSDDTDTVCTAYGTWVEKNMYGKKYMGIQRDTYLIAKSGQIAKIWRKVKVPNHVEAVLDEAEDLA